MPINKELLSPKADWSNYKKAPIYKIIWCALRHVKKYKTYSYWDLGHLSEKDIKVYGCMKCNIWRRVDE